MKAFTFHKIKITDKQQTIFEVIWDNKLDKFEAFRNAVKGLQNLAEELIKE